MAALFFRFGLSALICDGCVGEHFYFVALFLQTIWWGSV